ncbi:lasso peptide isopeptide bond-forming cyclase [Streptomyces albireticuli]|uniref:Asparagine synthase n=1 Tax=Streptomyces albireticuli TaxID=1940 RepID=A0A2A2D0Z4_9ACTN|nr:lasso peptide isopeptide bond-forming cyclase [Streptomyces albireticuli]MCD9145737.1 lasso peptide isopeptide bond-forming cyclase [Streptomyces albireticuli]MCD9165531.1 lasso peptide isopeptide bond-forming cyclase [Streptomyces albireticuli]MCD9195946.1 lasso peptide isopeptide bond-forming cyclase [Streptomyces albireticuli]PAU45184.1 asparagine synthase [Streptomyces albireticuli]
MDHSLSLQAVPAWFAVLPDTDAAAPLARKALSHASRSLRHASGRPWVVGRWAPEDMVVGAYEGTYVAVTGEHAVTPHDATRAAAVAARARSLDALDHAADWAGSFHLMASGSGQARVQGGVVDLRRVFHTTTGAYGIAADRADILAELTGAELDERRVALELLTLGAPHPYTGRPLWRGLHALPGGHWLALRPDGQGRVRRWWSPPDPVVPLTRGAADLREALVEAVGLRTRGRDLVTSDLGGLDSTALYCTAVRGDAKVVAYTAALHDEAGDDVYWAGRTVEALGGVEHHVVPAGDVAMTFDGIDALEDLLDTPSIITVDRNRRMGIIEMAAARGSRLHLTGLGGDELLAGTPARLHALILSRPLAALGAVRGYAAKYQWTRRATLRQLLDRRSYRSWLDRVARDLTEPAAPAGEPLLDWAVPPRMPPWATDDAVAAARELLRAAGTATGPRGRGHGEHRELAAMDGISQWARHIGQMAAPLGIAVSAPYYDARVITAALAVRPQDRITPWRYKPLIVEATRGIVPETSRTRDTKANATFEEEAGLRAHRRALLALCEDSRLARLGLADEDALRAWCRRPLSAETESYLLHPTIACEVWLRSRELTRPPTTYPAGKEK